MQKRRPKQFPQAHLVYSRILSHLQDKCNEELIMETFKDLAQGIDDRDKGTYFLDHRTEIIMTFICESKVDFSEFDDFLMKFYSWLENAVFPLAVVYSEQKLALDEESPSIRSHSNTPEETYPIKTNEKNTSLAKEKIKNEEDIVTQEIFFQVNKEKLTYQHKNSLSSDQQRSEMIPESSSEFYQQKSVEFESASRESFHNPQKYIEEELSPLTSENISHLSSSSPQLQSNTRNRGSRNRFLFPSGYERQWANKSEYINNYFSSLANILAFPHKKTIIKNDLAKGLCQIRRCEEAEKSIIIELAKEEERRQKESKEEMRMEAAKRENSAKKQKQIENRSKKKNIKGSKP